MEKSAKVKIEVFVTEELKRKVRAQANKKGVTISEIVRRALESWVDTTL